MPTKKDLKTRCEEYRDNLFKAFVYLTTHNLVRQYGSMLNSVSAARGVLSDAKRRSGYPWIVDVNPNWRIPVLDETVCGVPGNTELLVGGRIQVDDSRPKIEQSVNVCVLFTPKADVAETNGYGCSRLLRSHTYVVRRFHFDYDSSYIGNDRPRTHFQYGGTPQSEIRSTNMAYHLFSSLDIPRVPYAPYDIVLVLDLFLRQFRTPLEAVVADPKWKSVVCESERLWLTGYFGHLHQHINQNVARDPLHVCQTQHIDWM